MLRLLGALSLGHLVFGHHGHWHRHCRHHLGRGLLLGALLGLFISRANQNSGYEGVNGND